MTKIRDRLFAGLVLVLILRTCAMSAAEGETAYRNERWGFCISYPSGWSADEATNKAGIEVNAPPSLHPRATITVGALPNQPKTLDDPAAPDTGDWMSLDDVVRRQLDALRAYLPEPAGKSVRLIRRQRTEFGGVPAISTEVAYVEGRTEKLDETLWFIKEHAVYSLVLKCDRASRSKYEPVFKRVVGSFRAGCK